MLGKSFGAIQFITDAGKPIVAFWAIAYPLAYFVPVFDSAMLGMIFLGTILGHMWPIWWKFKDGGMGIATGVGMLFAINWFLALVGLSTYIAVVIVTKNSGFGGIWGAIVGIGLFVVPYLNNYQFFAYEIVVNVGIGGIAQYVYPSLVVLGLIIFKFDGYIRSILYHWGFLETPVKAKNKKIKEEKKLKQKKAKEEKKLLKEKDKLEKETNIVKEDNNELNNNSNNEENSIEKIDNIEEKD
jgi:glycerol-3-phosphate acyltransferase PlsY